MDRDDYMEEQALASGAFSMDAEASESKSTTKKATTRSSTTTSKSNSAAADESTVRPSAKIKEEPSPQQWTVAQSKRNKKKQSPNSTPPSSTTAPTTQAPITDPDVLKQAQDSAMELLTSPTKKDSKSTASGASPRSTATSSSVVATSPVLTVTSQQKSVTPVKPVVENPLVLTVAARDLNRVDMVDSSSATEIDLMNDPNYVANASAALSKMVGAPKPKETSPQSDPVTAFPSTNPTTSTTASQSSKKPSSGKSAAVPTSSQKTTTSSSPSTTSEKKTSKVVSAATASADQPKHVQSAATTTTQPSASPKQPAVEIKAKSSSATTTNTTTHATGSSSPVRLAREWEFKHQLPQNLASVILHVGEPKIFGASPTALGVIGATGGAAVVLGTVTSSISDGHVRFKITRSVENDEQITPQFVHRRYRDFQALFLRLAHCFPNLVLPALPSSWATLVKTEEFLQTRARRLEGYLVSLLRNRPEIWRSPDLQAFLVKDSEAFDEMATKYLSNNGQDLTVPPPSVSSKVGESLSYWVKTAQASILNAPQAIGMAQDSNSPAASYNAGELASGFEALNAYVDENGQVQERTAVVERLTSAFESYLQATEARADSLRKLQDSLYDFAVRGGNDEEEKSDVLIESLAGAFDPSLDFHVSQRLIGEAKALASDTETEGPLRRLHQCAALLAGAREVNNRFTSAPIEASPSTVLVPPIADVPGLTKQFSHLRKQTSKMAICVSKEFASLALERTTADLEKLREVKAKMMVSE